MLPPDNPACLPALFVHFLPLKTPFWIYIKNPMKHCAFLKPFRFCLSILPKPFWQKTLCQQITKPANSFPDSNSLTYHHAKHPVQFIIPTGLNPILSLFIIFLLCYLSRPPLWVYFLVLVFSLALPLCLTSHTRSHEGGSHLKVQPNVSNRGRDVSEEKHSLSHSLSNTSLSTWPSLASPSYSSSVYHFSTPS